MPRSTKNMLTVAIISLAVSAGWQFVHEVIIDNDFMNTSVAREGGYKRFDGINEGR